MTWDVVSTGVRNAANPAGFPQWPRPYNWIQDIKVLACQETYVAKVKFAKATAANFFWSTFVPQPSEIARKTVTGSYKCGFYLGIKFPSPFEIIAGEGTAEIFAAIARPFATGLFIWWASETAFGALNSWSSIMYPEVRCPEGKGDVVWRNGRAPISAGYNIGGAFFFDELYDHHGYGHPVQGNIDIPAGFFSINYAFYFNAAAGGLHNCRAGITIGGTQVWLASVADVPPGGIVQGSVAYSGHATVDTTITTLFECTSDFTVPPGGFNVKILVSDQNESELSPTGELVTPRTPKT